LGDHNSSDKLIVSNKNMPAVSLHLQIQLCKPITTQLLKGGFKILAWRL